MNEGELWLVDFGDPFPSEPAGHRPALVVSAPGFNLTTPYCVVVPGTTSRRGLVYEVEIEPGPANGLHDVTLLRPDLLRTVSQRRGVHHIGVADQDVHDRVRHLIGLVLNM